MRTLLLIGLAFSSGAFAQAHAEGCADYPYTRGIHIEDVQGGTKITSTSSVGVTFDDIDAINDATDEATLEAKAQIAHFMNEQASDSENIDKAVRDTTSMQGSNKEALRGAVVERVKKLAGSASAVLRGVVPLGDCYTKAREVRVTVGIKPETIAAAGQTAQAVSDSLANKPADKPANAPAVAPARQPANETKPDAPVASMPLARMPSYSNTKNLTDF